MNSARRNCPSGDNAASRIVKLEGHWKRSRGGGDSGSSMPTIGFTAEINTSTHPRSDAMPTSDRARLMKHLLDCLLHTSGFRPMVAIPFLLWAIPRPCCDVWSECD